MRADWSVEPDGVMAVTAAALLKTVGGALSTGSALLALAALLVLGLRPTDLAAGAWLAASLAIALVHAYFAIRVAFDAAIFAGLGDQSAKYESFDRVLAVWGWTRAQAEATRPLPQRIDGARRWLRRQCYSALTQAALFIAGMATTAIR